MTATYTFDVFSSLDGFGAASANWTGAHLPTHTPLTRRTSTAARPPTSLVQRGRADSRG